MTPQVLKARIEDARTNQTARAFVLGPVPPPALSKKATKRAARLERLERGVEFCFQSVRATAEAAEEAHNGDTEGAEHDRERPQMRQFTRELNALVHRQFRERTGGPGVPHRFMRQDVSAVPGYYNDDGNGDGGDDDENDGEEEDANVRSIGPAVAPSGFTIDTNPPGSAPEDLIGSRVLFRWAGGPLRRSEYGWYISEVELIATDTKEDNDPGVTHQCLFKNTETNSKLPFRFGWRRKDAESLIPLGLTLGTWGVEKKWVVLLVACEEPPSPPLPRAHEEQPHSRRRLA